MCRNSELDYYYGKIYRSIRTTCEAFKMFKGFWSPCLTPSWIFSFYYYSAISLYAEWVPWLFKHGCSRHQNYNCEVNDKWIKAIWSNSVAILAAILNLQCFDYLVRFVLVKLGSLIPNMGCRHQKYNSEVNNKWIIAIWSNLAAILPAILDLQLI